MGLLRHFYGILFKSWIHSEGELKASGMRQWLGTRGWNWTILFCAPGGWAIGTVPMGSFALWLPVGFSHWEKPPAGYPRVEGGWVWVFIPPVPFVQSLWVWQHTVPKICRSCQAVLTIYIALDPGTVPSSISSILGVEIVPNVANSVLVSLNPANTLISNPFNKLSSKYPIWMFLARTLTDTLRQVIEHCCDSVSASKNQSSKEDLPYSIVARVSGSQETLNFC